MYFGQNEVRPHTWGKGLGDLARCFYGLYSCNFFFPPKEILKKELELLEPLSSARVKSRTAKCKCKCTGSGQFMPKKKKCERLELYPSQAL